MITLAPYYRNIEGIKLNKKLKQRQGFDYKKCLDMMKLTFYKNNPNDYDFIVQTDELTQINHNVHRTVSSHLNLMESIMIGNMKYVHDSLGKHVLVGADHLICKDIGYFFDDRFDLGFFALPEFDSNFELNINNTVVLINKTDNNCQSIDTFFTDRYNKFKDLQASNKAWYGDQKSISLLLEDEKIITNYYESKKKKTLFRYKDLIVKIFPYGELYLKNVQNLKNFVIEDSDILIDFAGNNKVKQYFEVVFNKIMGI